MLGVDRFYGVAGNAFSETFPSREHAGESGSRSRARRIASEVGLVTHARRVSQACVDLRTSLGRSVVVVSNPYPCWGPVCAAAVPWVSAELRCWDMLLKPTLDAAASKRQAKAPEPQVMLRWLRSPSGLY